MNRSLNSRLVSVEGIVSLLTLSYLLPFTSLAFAVLFFLSGCTAREERLSRLPGYPAPYKIGKRWYQPMKHARGYRQRGTASWYGEEFHGRRTSSGEPYDMYAFTAAHRTLPFGTYVRVRNLRNGQEVVVRVNDRGPFVHGRIIDLSYSAANRIGLIGPGTAPVKVTALGVPKETTVQGKVKGTLVQPNYYVGDFSVQVGAFKNRANAVKLKDKLAPTYKDVHIVVYESKQGTFYRVRVTRCTTLSRAREYEKMLVADGFPDAIVVAR